jgi:hypothetical protein
MAETTADVRRDIELTRERMSSTLDQLERKLNVSQIVKDNPWPAVGVAFGAGLLLSGTRSDVKAAGVTLAATRGASSKIAPALDDIVARLMEGVGAALQGHVDTLIDDVKRAIGARHRRAIRSTRPRTTPTGPRPPSPRARLSATRPGPAPGRPAFGGGASGAYGAVVQQHRAGTAATNSGSYRAD